MLAQAIANSRKDQGREPLTNIPFGPTFYPTVEDFSGDPLLYLEKIRPQAEKYGICKIVPPKGWNPPFALNVDSTKKFQTKDQSIHRLQEGISFGDGIDYSVKEYQKMSSEWSKRWKNKHYSHPDEPDSSDPGSLENTISESNLPPELKSSTMNGLAQPTNGTAPGEKSLKPKMTPEALERDYWNIVETQYLEVDVDYGNDVDTSDDFGSGFPISERGRSVNSPGFQAGSTDEELPEPAFGTDAYYKETFWNLNNIPNSKNSVLRHLKVGINGINVPWLYFGCLFSTFCWHNEDNYMYSINYHHRGSPKQWYGVPGTKQDADGVERVFKSYLSMKMRDVPDLLHHITTSFSPRLLNQEGVPVCKLLQNAGEYIVTFPRAFHGGFSLGPNCGEAVNFALHDWIPHAVDANERYRTFARPSVFSHDRLVYTMAHHIDELRTKEICASLAEELQRLMEEELLLRKKLIKAGVRDVSKDVQLPPNRLDQLDEESADYDDKRLCHSCKHICFFSAVCCECSDSKVSCLRHSHYMCRCSIKRKYILVWTKEKEMKDIISKVESRAEELSKLGDSKKPNALSIQKDSCDSAADSARDILIHQTYEVPVGPICPIDSVPELVSSSDTSVCSSRSSGEPGVQNL
jgi:histone demethylase JARID1